jgi:hypothetical protein
MEPALEPGAGVALGDLTQSVAASLKQWDEAQVLDLAVPAAEPVTK